MNLDELKGTWKNLLGIAEEKWGRLSDDHLDSSEGKHDQLVGRIQDRYGILNEDAESQVDSWMQEL